MKKMRVLFAISALLLAMGGAFASQLLTPASSAYEYISSGTGSCNLKSVTCFTSGSNPCTVGGSNQLRETSDVNNTCGQLMWFN